MGFQPKISIIVAVKNAKELLAATLQSIRGQQYQPLEVVVIDGNSTDGTQAVVDLNQDIVSSYVSEPDQGISDAFNKGLNRATGDYINFQGAGDVLYAPDCLQKVFRDLDASYKLVCGKVLRVKENGIDPLWIAPHQTNKFKSSSLLFKMSLPHQGLFTHRSFFEQFGQFDLHTRFAMDYELLLRAYDLFPKTVVKNVLVSKWRAGGVGSNRILEIFDEYHRIKMQHQIAPPLILKTIDKWNRLKYQIKAKWLRLPY